jgi:hypothetical protein
VHVCGRSRVLHLTVILRISNSIIARACTGIGKFGGVTVLEGAFVNLRKATVSFVMSVSPHGTARLPQNGFLLILIFTYLSKLCPDFN